MKPHISIITLGVKDLKSSTNFYKKIGFPVSSEKGITFIKTAGTWLSLYPLNELSKDANTKIPSTPQATFTLAHNVLSEEQVTKVIEEVRASGAKVIDEPRKKDWGGFSGYFQDVDGYLWEVAYNPFSPEIAVKY